MNLIVCYNLIFWGAIIFWGGGGYNGKDPKIVEKIVLIIALIRTADVF